MYLVVAQERQRLAMGSNTTLWGGIMTCFGRLNSLTDERDLLIRDLAGYLRRVQPKPSNPPKP